MDANEVEFQLGWIRGSNALPCSKNRKLFVAEVIDVQEDEVLFCYMEAARGGFKWPTVEDVSWEHHSSVTRHLDNPVLDIQKREYPVLDIQKSSNCVQIFKLNSTLTLSHVWENPVLDI
ncbi:hypothetical protein MAR_027158 [Mya arenaria]|uniref:Uncharacterized protein n=1 Tax=Mya arenaria TaxID=6604 RepID=A0ABY7ESM8_MYAAR|nr:hypothetical protein MAR_027158 [Mya arenaria]